MESEHTPINSKTCVNCNNVEGDLISVCLEGLQSLKGKFVQMQIFWIILRNKRGITCQIKYSSIRIVDVIISALYGKNKNKKILLMTTVLNQLFFDQREKVFIGKRISFSVKKNVVLIRKTLIAVKVGTKLVPYLFKPLFWINKELKNGQMMY